MLQKYLNFFRNKNQIVQYTSQARSELIYFLKFSRKIIINIKKVKYYY